MVFREFMTRLKRCLDEVKVRRQTVIKNASPEWPDTHIYDVVICSIEAAYNRFLGRKVVVPDKEQTISGLITAKEYFASRKRKREVAVLTLAIDMLERREKMG